jgi:hypothetical protein
MTTTSDVQVATPARRVVVVSAQRETESGIELLALCQPVTAGGWLSDAEIASLRAWLDARREEQASPYAHLFPVVADCIASGRVTRDACRTLFNAIAAVLPTEVRAIARSSRRSLEEKDAERYKLERDAHWQQPRDERERNRPIARLEFMAAGTREEGRPAVIERFARRGDPVFLVRDPGNVRSGHTIQVRVAGGMQLGFVPEEIASDIARLLDAGCPLEAEIATPSGAGADGHDLSLRFDRGRHGAARRTAALGRRTAGRAPRAVGDRLGRALADPARHRGGVRALPAAALRRDASPPRLRASPRG